VAAHPAQVQFGQAQDRQRLAVPIEQPLNGFAHIDKEVPTISSLHSIGRTSRHAIRIRPGAITADDLNAWMLLKPGGERLSCAIRQEIHRALPLQAHEDRVVLVALFPGPIVNAQHAWRWCSPNLLPPGQAQQGVMAGWHFQVSDKPSTHAAAQACFDYCMDVTGRDIHRLDGDNDGIACESLPAPSFQLPPIRPQAPQVNKL
jgi:hypothetical protein